MKKFLNTMIEIVEILVCGIFVLIVPVGMCILVCDMF